MRTVGIISNNAEQIFETFDSIPHSGVRLVNASGENDVMLDALIVQDAKPALLNSVNFLNDGAYLILNMDKREIRPLLPGSCEAYKLITYGFNRKACVTASSTMDGMLQACVQRGFITLDGDLREPCEFGLPLEGDSETALGIAAALMVCGNI
jgi:hypothetical protein